MASRKDTIDIENGLHATMLPAPVTGRQRQDAAEVLESYHQHGRLAPIDGWDGDILSGYLDILGLNDREPAGNSRFNMGVQSAMPPGARMPRNRRKNTTAAVD